MLTYQSDERHYKRILARNGNTYVTKRWLVTTYLMVIIVCSRGRAQATLQAAATPGGRGMQASPLLAERNPTYRINRDDVIAVSFPLSPEFNQPKVTVLPDGYITMQGAGSIFVLGLTVPEAVTAVAKAYSRTLHEPIVDIDLIDFQRAYFVVLGQVGKPGQYDLRYDMTVTEAIAAAGGFSPAAKTRIYLYHRGPSGWLEARELHLRDILTAKSISEDLSVQPGDMIFVPEKTIAKIRKYIPYGIGTSVDAGTF
jgi:polysaccharide export outer membrane protein